MSTTLYTAAHKMGAKPELKSSPEYLFTAISMLMAESRNGVFPEILYLISPDQLRSLCETFGGQTVRIPTLRELGDALKSAAVAHYRRAANATDEQLMELLGINKTDIKVINRRIDAWQRVVEDSIGLNPTLLYTKTDGGNRE
jgi:hypothetical protein